MMTRRPGMVPSCLLLESEATRRSFMMRNMQMLWVRPVVLLCVRGK
jgi:hypothetical protein